MNSPTVQNNPKLWCFSGLQSYATFNFFKLQTVFSTGSMDQWLKTGSQMSKLETSENTEDNEGNSEKN